MDDYTASILRDARHRQSKQWRCQPQPANGYGGLVAEVLPDNHRMLDMFLDCGLPLDVRAEPGVVHVRMPSGIPLAVGSGGIPLTAGSG